MASSVPSSSQHFAGRLMPDVTANGDMSRLKLKGLLIDLNGTLHVGTQPTRGAVEALEKLRKANLPFVFCSNSTKESTKALVSSLQDQGFKVVEREVLTSLGACRALVEKRNLRPFLLLSSSAKEEFVSAEGKEGDYDSVILGLDPPSLSYEPLNTAFRILKGEPLRKSDSGATRGRRTASLIAPHASMYHQAPETDDLPAGLSLGIGSFVRGLEVASGAEAELVGKPNRRFFETAIERLRDLYGQVEGDIAVVGDDVVNDLGEGAKELNLKRILVRTGKYREGVEKDHDVDGIYDDFAEFIDDIID